MKPSQLGCRKGKSWSVPNVDELSEIDFDALAEKTHLRFSEELRISIKYELAMYVSQVRVFESRPLSPKRQSSLKAVIKACSVLETVLDMDAKAEDEHNDFDAMGLYLWRFVVPKNKFEFDGADVAEYLAMCREKAEKEVGKSYRAGRRYYSALRCCLRRLKGDYILAGGEGRGCCKASDGTVGGTFLVFLRGCTR